MCCITMHVETFFGINCVSLPNFTPLYSSNFLFSLLILPGLTPMPELQGVQLLPAATS